MYPQGESGTPLRRPRPGGIPLPDRSQRDRRL